ncbi:MAG: transpeptidase family protein [Dysgonamonadaceae bacterium]|jgi:cell division protein FtsI (penicillin-binding protein 3)|nr:transpeptidase family protein [Dysgonamonadaceae bacterium]
MSSELSLNKKIISCYFIIAALVIIVAVLIFGKACTVSFVDGNAWRKLGEKQVKPNIKVPATRGNIYSDNYELMATTESRYRLYLDFWAEGISPDTLKKYVKPLSIELNKMFPQKSASYYENHIMRGWNMREQTANQIKRGNKNAKKNREYRLLTHDVNYIQWKTIREMPYFEKGIYKSGLYKKEFVTRTKPYGTLASRTIGDIYGEFDKGGKNGLECHYDSLLRGEEGTSTRRKVNGRFIDVIDMRPINGKDIISTINIDIQDITEKALLSKLKEIDAESGTAVVMETATGEIKAITNMGRIREGVWGETKNYAVSDLSEPGSTFKVVSMMVALEDEAIHPEDSVDTENGVVQIAGQTLKDHNANRGGYGMITAAKSIRYSSNIGVARLIMRAYGDNPGRFVDGIRKIGFQKDMNLEIPGYGVPRIRHPKDTNVQYWSKSTLPWMSFGYETQIPPIYTLTFFNAIANNGKLIKPIFVKEIQENGKVIERKKAPIVNEKICSSKTLSAIRQMLDDVVNTKDGTGKPAYSDKVRIAGKTGTAQLSQGSSGYRAEGLSHQVSFCGYFPSDNPKYSMIVVIRKPRNGPPSGGWMCGSVFKSIAEEVYAKNMIYTEKTFPVDTIHPVLPAVKNGLKESSLLALRNLDIEYNEEQSGAKWITSNSEEDRLLLKGRDFSDKTIPDVKGMGAKDAIYVLENLGLKVHISGKGSVNSQSISPGNKVNKGQTITLLLK